MMTEGKLLLCTVLCILLIFIVAGIIYLLRYKWYKNHSNLSDYGIRQNLDFVVYLTYTFIGFATAMLIIGLACTIVARWDVPI